MKERLKLLKQAIKPLIIFIASSIFLVILVLFGEALDDLPFFNFAIIGFVGAICGITAIASFLFILMDIFQALSGNKYEPSLVALYILNVIVISISSIFILNEDVNICFIIIFSLIFSLLTMYLYFLPYFIAVKNEHIQERAIFILNVFAGWTIIAWIIALIWANTAPKEKIVIEQKPESNADELKKYKDLLDSGVITQEEFDAKKKQLLGL